MSFKELLFDELVNAGKYGLASYFSIDVANFLKSASGYLEKFDGIFRTPDTIFTTQSTIQLGWNFDENVDIYLNFFRDVRKINTWDVLTKIENRASVKRFTFALNENGETQPELDQYLRHIIQWEDGELEPQDECGDYCSLEVDEDLEDEIESYPELYWNILEGLGGEDISEENYQLYFKVQDYLSRFEGVLIAPSIVESIDENGVTVSWNNSSVIITLRIIEPYVSYLCYTVPDFGLEEIFSLSLDDETPKELDAYLKQFVEFTDEEIQDEPDVEECE